MSRNCRIFGRARPVIVPRRGGQVITMHNRRHIASHRNLFSTEGSQNARVHQGASIAVFISKIVWLEPDLRVRKVSGFVYLTIYLTLILRTLNPKGVSTTLKHSENTSGVLGCPPDTIPILGLKLGLKHQNFKLLSNNICITNSEI